MKRAAGIGEAIQHMKGGYDVVPANIMLAGAEQELSQTGKEHRLKEAVSEVAGNYDFVMIDTPPSLVCADGERLYLCHGYSDTHYGGIFATAGISPAQWNRWQRPEVL